MLGARRGAGAAPGTHQAGSSAPNLLARKRVLEALKHLRWGGYQQPLRWVGATTSKMGL